jgi:ribosomal protein S18 acetylase RimI-like enzyme
MDGLRVLATAAMHGTREPPRWFWCLAVRFADSKYWGVAAVEIRRAIVDDLADLVSVQRETNELHVGFDPTVYRTATDAEFREAMAGFLAAADTTVWIAREEGAAAGFLIFKIVTSPQNAFCHARNDGLIDQLSVAERFRRRGIGRALISEAERYAASQGCRELRLGVVSTNFAAREFYAALAFEPAIERWRKRLV